MALVIILTIFSIFSTSSPPVLVFGESAPTATAFGANLPRILLLTTLPFEALVAMDTGVLRLADEGLAEKKVQNIKRIAENK